MNSFLIYSFYRFKKINKLKKLKKDLDTHFKNKLVKGTILLANEGINASISGDQKTLDGALKYIKKKLKIRKLNLKINDTEFLPFNRMKVRLKKEIVSLGIKNLKLNNRKANYIHPSEWDKIILNKNIKVIDVRNTYEIKIGKFKNTINPITSTFRQFPDKIKNLNLSKEETLAIYCTGGIRCEKASIHLNKIGYKNILQLEGGVLNYLEYKKKFENTRTWSGDCFVFDDRVSVNKKLKKGRFNQCYGCRRPITKKDMSSNFYIKGVYCPYCYNRKSQDKIKSSLTRQDQIEKAKENNTFSSFIKVGKDF
tara:strand:+ start:2311 stop:3240 length:930 start_codon:yes stop_codon:yes gene_type:complete